MNHVKTSTKFSFAVIIYLLQYNTTVFSCYNYVNNKSKKNPMRLKIIAGKIDLWGKFQ